MYKRYSNPSALLDQMILSSNISKFIDEVLDLQNDDVLWEFFLHRVADISFDEFKKSLEEPDEMSAEELETTVKESIEILRDFNPLK